MWIRGSGGKGRLGIGERGRRRFEGALEGEGGLTCLVETAGAGGDGVGEFDLFGGEVVVD